MDNFLDNQAVTVDMLNDIAVDLGAAGFAAFGENKFGVDELNGITQALVTEGILNTGNGCKAVKSGESINIQDGIIVFKSGAKKKIEEAVTLAMMNNAYIYALNNEAQNQIQLIVSQTQPTEEDYVMIAQTDADGELIDKRKFAVGKYAPAEVNLKVTKTTEVNLSASAPEQYVECGFGGFTYILYENINDNDVYIDISDGEEHSFRIVGSPAGAIPYVKKSGTGILILRNSFDVNKSITFTVI